MQIFAKIRLVLFARRAAIAGALAMMMGADSFAQPAPDKPSLTLDPAAVQRPWTGDLDGMLKRRYIRVLTVYSKTFYFVDNGVLRGTVVDFSRLFEDQLNKKAAADKTRANKNLKVRVVFIPVRRDQLLPSLMAGRGDIAAANLTITPDRLKLVEFTKAGLTNVSEVAVTGPSSPKIASVDDLSGKQIFVRQSSSYYESLESLNKRFVAEHKQPAILRVAPESLEDEDLLEMLNAGLVPIVIVDRHIADFWKPTFSNINVHDEIAVRTGGGVGWAIRKNAPLLKAALDDFVTRNKEGTSNGNTILQRYLKNLKYVKNAGSDAERKKFQALIQTFQRYGAQYDVDWVLMAAQGYQESQLNQDAKSRVGAIGIMQLMPATGKQMNVGDIHQTGPNIAAGTKYMRFMIDQYYAHEPMRMLDKALFTFASYNAGAGRIDQMRKESTRRGLDPNKWFGNVEYVAAEMIGQETVTYVSNIYKYYVAYRLILENQAATRIAINKVKAGSH
jgi:membrane-bound lytic murein transglycosylase MltF